MNECPFHCWERFHALGLALLLHAVLALLLLIEPDYHAPKPAHTTRFEFVSWLGLSRLALGNKPATIPVEVTLPLESAVPQWPESTVGPRPAPTATVALSPEPTVAPPPKSTMVNPPFGFAEPTAVTSLPESGPIALEPNHVPLVAVKPKRHKRRKGSRQTAKPVKQTNQGRTVLLEGKGSSSSGYDGEFVTYVPPRTDAAYLKNPKPVYPTFARRQGVQGVVLLTVEVDISGLPLKVTIKQGSGSLVLDQSAQRAVKQWRFAPAQRGGKPVRATVDVPIRFRLMGG